MINKAIQISTPIFVKASQFAGLIIAGIQGVQFLKKYWWILATFLLAVFCTYKHYLQKEAEKQKQMK